MVELRQLTTGYHASGNDTIISPSLNAKLSEGELTCLIGPNGAGKSTLLRTIAGFQPAIKGEVYVGGIEIASFSPNQLSKTISIVLTDNTQIHNLSVFDVVAMGRMPHTGFWGRLNENDRMIVTDCLEMVGISHLSNHMIETLSDGERQKAMIAKAIAQQTPIILLDEPTAFLYYPNKVNTMLLLRRLAHEMHKTILLSIHDIDLALQTADNIWLMNHCSQLTTGTPKQLCEQGIIQKEICSEYIDFDATHCTFHAKI